MTAVCAHNGFLDNSPRKDRGRLISDLEPNAGILRVLDELAVISDVSLGESLAKLEQIGRRDARRQLGQLERLVVLERGAADVLLPEAGANRVVFVGTERRSAGDEFAQRPRVLRRGGRARLLEADGRCGRSKPAKVGRSGRQRDEHEERHEQAAAHNGAGGGRLLLLLVQVRVQRGAACWRG